MLIRRYVSVQSIWLNDLAFTTNTTQERKICLFLHTKLVFLLITKINKRKCQKSMKIHFNFLFPDDRVKCTFVFVKLTLSWDFFECGINKFSTWIHALFETVLLRIINDYNYNKYSHNVNSKGRKKNKRKVVKNGWSNSLTFLCNLLITR